LYHYYNNETCHPEYLMVGGQWRGEKLERYTVAFKFLRSAVRNLDREARKDPSLHLRLHSG
jgi:hypothetical protein